MKRFASFKQMFGNRKMSPLLLRTNLPQIFTIYDIQALRNLSEDFQENILGGAILVYNRYSEQPVCNLTKRRTLPPVYFGEIFENGWLDGCFRTVQAKDFQENILGGVILVYNRYSEQSVCNLTKRRILPPLFSAEVFKNGWHSPSGRFPRKYSWWNHFSIITTQNSQSVI